MKKHECADASGAKKIAVVDESGRCYEATYLKRAKGLVKHGRARFIDENTICLACPPDNELEDKTMSENKSTKQPTNIPNVELSLNADRPLTAREIFEKIAELQKQLTESSYHSLHRLDDSISSICSDENEEKCEQVGEVCSVFKMRETTLIKMLELYEKMYNDLNTLETQKVEIIKSAFSEHVESINKSDLNKEDKFAAIGDVTDKIADLTEKLLIPTTTKTARHKIADEMTRIIKCQSSSAEGRQNAVDILKVYMSGN